MNIKEKYTTKYMFFFKVAGYVANRQIPPPALILITTEL